ncbi:MAG: exodeoxyribonuclease III [Calditrichota bacterium]
MKILSWNVNGYRAVLKKGFIPWLENSQPDIICLQETKAWAEQLKPPEINPSGYTGHFSQPERKGYSGVATLCRVKPQSIDIGFGIETFDREGRVLLTDYGKFLLANIYFPNGRQGPERLEYKMRFYQAVYDFFGSLYQQGRGLIVVGDYNTAHREIDLAHPKENEKTSGFLPEERAWIDQWMESGFVDIFRLYNSQAKQYTWWDMRTRARERNIGWRLDYFFVSRNLVDAVRAAWIEPEVMGSDHCPIGLEVDI